MKIIYASRTGNVEAFVDKLGLSDVMKIEDGSEQATSYVLVTYTDGYSGTRDGRFPGLNYDRLRGVAASGDKVTARLIAGGRRHRRHVRRPDFRQVRI